MREEQEKKVKVSSLLFTQGNMTPYRMSYNLVDIDTFEGDEAVFTAIDLIALYGKLIDKNCWLRGMKVEVWCAHDYVVRNDSLRTRHTNQVVKAIKALPVGTSAEIPHLQDLCVNWCSPSSILDALKSRDMKRSKGRVSFKYSSTKPKTRPIQPYYNGLTRRLIGGLVNMLDPGIRGNLIFNGQVHRVETIMTLKLLGLPAIIQSMQITKTTGPWDYSFSKQDLKYIRKLIKDPAATLLETDPITVEVTS